MFKGKVAFITGAGSGVGRETALAFARAGAQIAAVDLDFANSQETVRLIRAAGGQAVCIQADVSRAAQVESAVRATVETFGRLDCAFNNAGVVLNEQGRLVDYQESDWSKTIDINLKGVWLGMKYQIPAMLDGGGGAIVNNASVMGVVGGCCCAYVAAKHGVLGLTKAGALEYARRGIRINAVCPGGIDTTMMASVPAQEREGIVARHPIGRLARADEIADVVLWLCSDRASFLCGSSVMVDGGYTIQ